MKANQTNNNENWPVCPECIGLNGSKKRNWMENHADYIVSTYESMGFEYACHYFICKSDTMLRFLKRHDLGDQPAVRRDEITRQRVGLIDTKVYDLMKELDRQDIGITELQNRGYQLTDIMIAWHQKQAELNTMMVGFLENLTPDLTYHISSADTHKVDPTPLITEQNSTKRIKAGPTLQVGRRFVSSNSPASARHLVHRGWLEPSLGNHRAISANKRTGKQQLPGPGTQSTLRSRYEQSKSRRRGRV